MKVGLKLLIDIFVSRCKLVAEEMHECKIQAINAVNVSGMDFRLNIGGVIEKNVEDIMAFVFVRPDHTSIDGDMVGDECIRSLDSKDAVGELDSGN